jgi:hypothetical protein
LRLGDLTLRKPHYQTARVNRQLLATPLLIATINRDKDHRRRRNKSRSGLSLSLAAELTAMIQVPLKW